MLVLFIHVGQKNLPGQGRPKSEQLQRQRAHPPTPPPEKAVK